ncbi:MAG: response regulator transcription factor [Polyangiaceae bacterium]|nr:response regulator transcription factor [Polyangiaceae bacterium]
MSIPPPTRVLIVDDHRVVRDGVRRYLQSYDGIEVIGTASDGEEAVGLVADLKPTIVLMDIDMPKMNGVDATRRISKISPSTRVLAFTAHHRAPLTRDMVKAGVWGVIDKGSCGPEEIAAAIARVEEGERIIPPELEAAALEADSGETPELSPREREVLLLIADGLTSKAIGEKLGIGLRTVETYRERLTNKLGIQGTVGLTKWAISRGLLKAEQ